MPAATKKKTAAKTVKKTAPKKAAKKAAPRKKTATKKVSTAPKKRVIKSEKVKSNNRNFASAVSLATEVIYDAGKTGSRQPTWGQALRAAYGSGSLAGTPRRRKTARR